MTGPVRIRKQTWKFERRGWREIIPNEICHNIKNISKNCQNKTSAKRKSTMSSLNPSIIQVDTFKCMADLPHARRISWLIINSTNL